MEIQRDGGGVGQHWRRCSDNKVVTRCLLFWHATIMMVGCKMFRTKCTNMEVWCVGVRFWHFLTSFSSHSSDSQCSLYVWAWVMTILTISAHELIFCFWNWDKLISKLVLQCWFNTYMPCWVWKVIVTWKLHTAILDSSVCSVAHKNNPPLETSHAECSFWQLSLWK